MSSDNAWYVKGSKVFMIDASDWDYYSNQAEARTEKRYKAHLEKNRPHHEAESHEAAMKWAQNEYAEYGVWWVDE